MADALATMASIAWPSGPIVALRREETESRGAFRISLAWHEEPSSIRRIQSAPKGGLIEGTDGDVEVKALGSDPVLFAISPIAGADVTTLLRAVLGGGRRVYVLAEVEDAQRRLAAEIAGVPGSRALIRTAASVPFSALVSTARATGFFWLRGHGGQPGKWRLRLQKAYAESLFRVLNHLFWHQSVLEAWYGPRGVDLKPVVGDPPFDALLPPPSAPVSLSEGPATLTPESSWTVWHEPRGQAPLGTARKTLILIPPSGDGLTSIGAWVDQGADVAWTELGLPPFVVMDSGGIILGDADSRTLTIRLDRDQASSLAELAIGAAKSASWKLKRDVPLSGLTGRVWLPGEKQPAAPQDSVTVDCGTVRAPGLRAVAVIQPTSRPKVSPLARSVHWSWTVEPALVPPDAKPDSIHAAWESLDRDVLRRVEALRGQLKAYDERKGRIRSLFAALAGTLLGFESDRRQLEQEIESVSTVVPSKRGPFETREALEKLRNLEERASVLWRDLEKAETEERTKLERERASRDWEESRERARTRLPQIQPRIEELAKLIRERNKEFGDAGSLPDKKERKALISSIRADLERFEQERNKLAREAEELQELLEETGPPNEARSSGADGNASLGQKRAGGMGAVTGFIPPSPAQKVETIPTEAPPAVGRLLRAKSGRFLAIERWEELDQGEIEARRLGAELVASPAKSREGK